MTIEIKHVEAGDTFHVSVIYVKCKLSLRIPLWENLKLKSTLCIVPWCVIGDFNVITSMGEKIGGIPYQMKKSIDFISMIEECGLTDFGFYGPRYTWSNGRGPGSIVWKRLDRCLVNDHWLTSFPTTTIVTHLASASSDHSPLLMEMHVRQDNTKKYFRILNCWVKNESFMPLVLEVWSMQVTGSPMWVFHQKHKALSSALSKWSRQQYGDIFQKSKEYEQKVKLAEEKWATTNDLTNRITLPELQAQYIKHLKHEEEVLKQKTQLQWFKEGNANSSYFHSLIRGRRKKIFIHKIKDKEGDWIQGDEAIEEAACDYFEELITEP
ncbi:uncharacterized protein LOC107799029 [Nicotiana tabacum]|uniref:uncharacterized protein LOC107799029 n=1 Tax=Nicotiana tabacum TaxID=4097 RepID=UPI003F4F183F